MAVRTWVAGMAAWLVVAGCSCGDERARSRTKPPAPASPTPAAPLQSPPAEESPSTIEPSFFGARLVGFPRDRAESIQTLKILNFAVEYHVLGAAVAATVDLEVASRSKGDVEAIIDMPLPQGAAITKATLFVAGSPTPAVLLGRDKATRTYNQIVGAARDPLLVRWRPDPVGPGGSAWLQIFPLPPDQTRRVRLTWVEPVAEGRVRVPVLAHENAEVARPSSVLVDGKEARFADGDDHGVVVPGAEEIGSGVSGGFRYAVRTGPYERAGVVIVAQTSFDSDPDWTKERVAELLARLPNAEVELVAGDWHAATLGRGLASTLKLDALDRRRFAGVLDRTRVLSAALDAAERIGASGIVWIGAGVDHTPFATQFETAQRARRTPVSIVRVGGQAFDARWLWGGPAPREPWSRVTGSIRRVGAVHHRVEGVTTLAGQTVPLVSAIGSTVWIEREPIEGSKADEDPKGDAYAALWSRGAMSDPRLATARREMKVAIVDPMHALLALEKASDYRRHGIPIPRSPGGSGGGAGFRPRGSSGLRPQPAPKFPSARLERRAEQISGRGRAPGVVRREVRRLESRLRGCLEKKLTEAAEVSAVLVVAQSGSVDGEVSWNGPDATRPCAQVLRRLRLQKAGAKTAIELRYRFVPSFRAEWAKALELIRKGATPQAVVAALGPAMDGRGSGLGALWSLWGDVRKDRYPDVGCYVVPALIRALKDAELSVRVVTECALWSGKKRVVDELERWKLPEEAERAKLVSERITTGGYGYGSDVR